jgi:N-acetylmuramoyl-L-alanine amidase
LGLDSACLLKPSLNLKIILWDMIYTNNRAESIELASDICRMINRNLDTRILGMKGANFCVLKGVRMPALLIEVGFLSNYNEERMIKNNYYRQQIAQAIAEGIQNYTRDYALMEARRR